MSLIGLMVGATIAVAAPRSIAGLPAGEPRVDLSTIEHQTTFVQTEREGVTVRVGLVMVDHGGSTDVSPKGSLYLTLFAESEMRDNTALYRLTDANQLVSAERKAPGIYEVVLKRYDLDQVLKAGVEPTVRMEVDARQATVDLRAMRGVEEFTTGRVTTTIKVQEQAIR